MTDESSEALITELAEVLRMFLLAVEFVSGAAVSEACTRANQVLKKVDAKR